MMFSWCKRQRSGGLTMLVVTDVEKHFAGVTAVAGVSFAVGMGEIVSMIGPNGAGKTTVFNMITGFYKPDKGSVLFDGAELAADCRRTRSPGSAWRGPFRISKSSAR